MRELLSPVVVRGLGLPARAADMLLMTLARREVGAVMMKDLVDANGMSLKQIFIGLLVMTLFVPCVAHFLMMVKERGLKVGLGIMAFVTPVAILTGAGLHYVFRTFGIQF